MHADHQLSAAIATPPATGAAMDKRVPGARRHRGWQLAAALAASALLALLALWFSLPRGVAVSAPELGIASVQAGEFRDELLLRANAAALSSVMLDATEGGRVEAVHARDGALVKRGDPLFRLSNPQRQQEALARAADVAQQVTNLASLEVGLQASHAAYRRDLAELEFELDRTAKAEARQAELAAQGFVSPVLLQESRDQLALQQRLLAEARADAQAEQQTRQRAIGQMGEAIDGLNQGLKLVRATADALAVSAPADGRLVDFRLEQGESVKPGDRVGRIDSPGQYKLVAQVDEFYLARMALGLRGSAELAGTAYAVSLSRLNPQVKERNFSVELRFDGTTPPALQPGQTVDSRITLGQPSRALLLPDAPFFDETGGTWLFVLDPDGQAAQRRSVRLGRRAAGRIEVLGGLAAGERVVVSSYRNFREATRLRLEP